MMWDIREIVIEIEIEIESKKLRIVEMKARDDSSHTIFKLKILSILTIIMAINTITTTIMMTIIRVTT